MAKKIYVGVSDVARNVTKAYVGINGVARKIKAAYVGVEGIARKFFPAVQYIDFSLSPAPTSWTGSGTSAGSTRTATNSYGTWTIKNVQATASSYPVERAFDNVDSTYTRASSTYSEFAIQLQLPTNIKIKPTKYSARVNQIQANSYFKGNDGSWVTLQTNTSAYTSTTTITPSVSTNTYWPKFEFNSKGRSGNYSTLHEFKITNGTIEDKR